MVKSILNVNGMSCEHCVKAITRAVSALPGVSSVYVNLKEKTVTIEHDPALSSLYNIKLEIEDQGYDII